MTHSAELIAVGTELLLGNIANTNAQMISEALSTIGINVYYHTVVGDNPERLASVLEVARKRVDLIITIGGLGPTYDDLTKQTICKAFGKTLSMREDIVEKLRNRYRSRNRPMADNMLQQALLPDDCVVFENAVGTAPGCAIEADGVRVLMLPGPPFECRHMLEHCVVPYLSSLSNEIICSHDLRIFGMGESLVEQLLHERMTHLTNPTLAPYAKGVECMLRITAKAPNAEEAERMMAPVLDEVRAVLGENLYGEDVANIEQVVFSLLRERGKTLAVAESCTGGLLATRITDLPGASQVFLGGVVSYASTVKAGVLGVPEELLERYGAVSESVARAMAEGVRSSCGSDYALSVTGVAGPDKDERGNDVGKVFLALAGEDGTIVRQLMLSGGRERIRQAAGNHALDLLRRHMLGLPTENDRYIAPTPDAEQA